MSLDPAQSSYLAQHVRPGLSAAFTTWGWVHFLLMRWTGEYAHVNTLCHT
jgi:hypothetical protein